jgi:hypothetical protein
MLMYCRFTFYDVFVTELLCKFWNVHWIWCVQCHMYDWMDWINKKQINKETTHRFQAAWLTQMTDQLQINHRHNRRTIENMQISNFFLSFFLSNASLYLGCTILMVHTYIWVLLFVAFYVSGFPTHTRLLSAIIYQIFCDILTHIFPFPNTQAGKQYEQICYSY